VKLAKFHPAARDALRAFPEEVRRAFGKAIHDLQLGHSLIMPLSRPMPVLGTGAAELRISLDFAPPARFARERRV
jgi:phage-related protein